MRKMTVMQVFQLLFISAVWGSSHVFVRISAPSIGPFLTVFSRIFLASIFLGIVLKLRRISIGLKTHAGFLVLVGFLNVALPLSLYSLGSLYIPAGYSAVLNATMPFFAAVFSTLILKEPFTLRKVFGLGLGILGVTLLKQYGPVPEMTPQILISFGMGLLAAMSYGLCSVLVRKKAGRVPPLQLTAGSNLAALVLLAPFAASQFTQTQFQFENHAPGVIFICLAMMGIVGSGIAFLVYYRLIEEVGAFRAALNGLLVPVFGVIWSILLLHEEFNRGMALGMLFVGIGAAVLLTERKY